MLVMCIARNFLIPPFLKSLYKPRPSALLFGRSGSSITRRLIFLHFQALYFLHK